MISTIERRPCDGHPNRECPNDCDVDCHFNNATLDRVMNYPLRQPVVNEFADAAEPAEPETNHPYDWLPSPPLYLVVLVVGAAVAYGMYRTGTYRIIPFF